ncbi:hypothetical protein [Salinibaculum salinum]|uniref:hypothetical protein n=1 Tax=Salinibaculum salinum TaxID=3131996 RepID=UPI0030EBEC35
MVIDVDVPTPPDITNRGIPDTVDSDAVTSEISLRREELEKILRQNAWQEGFEEWWQYTDLSEADIQWAEELSLFHAFDFFWDSEAGRLRYVTPAVPDEWGDDAEEAVSPASVVQSELGELGDTVAETIATNYVDWGERELSDPVWSVDSFGQVPTRDEEER